MGDLESGLSARTIARRLSSVSGLYAYLVARGGTGVTLNPVPRGPSTRRGGGRSPNHPAGAPETKATVGGQHSSTGSSPELMKSLLNNDHP